MSREPFTTAIPRFSVTRPVSVVMLLATIVVVGYIAYSRVPLSLFPEDLRGHPTPRQRQLPERLPARHRGEDHPED
jgi:hypothetical protein